MFFKIHKSRSRCTMLYTCKYRASLVLKCGRLKRSSNLCIWRNIRNNRYTVEESRLAIAMYRYWYEPVLCLASRSPAEKHSQNSMTWSRSYKFFFFLEKRREKAFLDHGEATNSERSHPRGSHASLSISFHRKSKQERQLSSCVCETSRCQARGDQCGPTLQTQSVPKWKCSTQCA